MKGVQADYYFGTIVDVPDTSNSFNVQVNIPGVVENLTCYPLRCGSDEPKLGDLVVIRDLDPEYHSYFVYEKLNENDFTGMRCKGKMIDFTDKSLKIGIFDEGDFSDGEKPGNTSWIELDEDGKLDIVTEDDIYIQSGGSLKQTVEENLETAVEQNASITVGGHTTIDIQNGEDVFINGDVKVHINGNYSLFVSGELNIDATKITIGGQVLELKTSGAAPGPFNNFCTCVQAPGLKHGTNTILLKR